MSDDTRPTSPILEALTAEELIELRRQERSGRANRAQREFATRFSTQR